MRVRTRKNRDIEDASEWAGWVFADMLVGLMVIFLATISFVPFFVNSATGLDSPSGNFTFQERYGTAFIEVYDSPDLALIRSDINAFLRENDIPQDAIVDTAFFAGGFDLESETSSAGILRALEFSKALDKLDPSFLAGSSTVVNSTTSLSAGEVVVRLTFSSRSTTTN
jgi:hypothetical protein